LYESAQLQAAQGPRGLAIDGAAGLIYWCNQGDNTIRRAPLDGGDDETLHGPSGVVSLPGGVAVDRAARRIYWANEVDNTIRGGLFAGGGIANALYDTHNGVNQPGAVAIDPAAGRIYWTNGGDNTIRGGRLAGGGPVDTLYGPSDGVNGPVGVAIDHAARRIYWTNLLDHTILGAPLTIGGGVTSLYGPTDGVSGPSGVAVDPPELVFSIFIGSSESALSRWVSPVTNWLVEHWPGKRPIGRIYWANHDDNTICGAPLDGSGPVDTLYHGPDRGVYGPNFLAVLKAPVGTAPPAIWGNYSVGQLLRCSHGTWARDLPGSFLSRAPQSFRYQWTFNAADIAGATLSSYTPSAAGTYTCRVTATNQAGSTAQTSGPVSIL
jgi:hypothetical protein